MELGILHRYTVPSDELEFAVRAHAENQIFWKMGLPSAFSFMKEQWKAEAWIISGLQAVESFRGMFKRMLGKRKL